MTETINKAVRQIKWCNFTIGGENDFGITKPLFALELNIFNFNESHPLIKEYYGNLTEKELVLKAQETDCDILDLKFNISEDSAESDIKKAKELLKSLLPEIHKPLLIQGINNKNVDNKLLPELMHILDRECIIAFADENTYKDIVPDIIKGNHILVIRTPIDINLAKEMNILTTDMGLSPDRILIDTDMGGLGYGLEYGYSVMERIKLAAFAGDEMLNMPLIAFAGDEALKAKETKSDSFSKSYGKLEERAKMFEITTASSICAAGVNIVVVQHPNTISTIKSLL